ncbi:hypothetical protein Q8F55_007051 [Vanrija albida]|uniref:BAH domain-containing protein n=1 Tax=Vanrija albida TaxID=181172 RepID=A0ABR3PYR2_9TREE
MRPKRERSSSLTAAPSSALSSAPSSPQKGAPNNRAARNSSLGVLSPERTSASSSSSSPQAGTPTPFSSAYTPSLPPSTHRRKSAAAGPSVVKKPAAKGKARVKTEPTDAPSMPAPKRRKTLPARSSPMMDLSPAPDSPVFSLPPLPSSARRQARQPSPASSLTDLFSSPIKPPLSRTVSPVPRTKRALTEDSDSEVEVFSFSQAIDRAAKKKKLEQHQSPAARVEEPDLKETTPPPFRPTRLPPGVDIGDPCLIKDRTCYFVGVLLDFHPATTLEAQKKPNGDKYEVEDQTGVRRTVARKSIVFQTDPIIATVKIGHLKEVAVKRVAPPDAAARVNIKFKDLDRVQQLEKIRPHLHDIINEDYPPAQWRIDKSYGPYAHDLNGSVLHGDLPHDEVTYTVVPWLQKWVEPHDEPEGAALADGGADGDMGGEDGDASTVARRRPRGTKRYNALSARDRTTFVHNVLLPEAIIQLCIRAYDLTGSPGDVYDQAMAKLQQLGSCERSWRRRRTQINLERRRQRQNQNLPSDDEDDDESRRRHFYDLSYTNGRRERKTAISYRE